MALMDFVDLHRSFAPIHKDQETPFEFGRAWGRKMAGWLDWPELLKRRRVVLLAEALSGKTEEFRYQQEQLLEEGKPAFLIRIEQLADHGFDGALDPQGAASFATWKAANTDGYFFLDSVDEARLNRKSFDTALRRFARELGDHLGRAYLFISCRVSDWRWRQDRDAVTQYLPVPPPAPPPPVEPDRALLDPIFDKKEREAKKAKVDSNIDDLLVIQIVPLDNEQRQALAAAAGVNDTTVFMAAIDQQGLDALAERPGDLIDLIDYWRDNGRFGSLTQMTEHGIARKLAEQDKYRADNDTLTASAARHGAERIAAALTLGQTFTIRAPGQELDPTLAAGALEPDHVLPDWKENQRNALLRRPSFAPSTYGRIRFHHRGTQEYLTADWFHRLLNEGCPRSEVWPVFFAERYGVETVVPSMRAAAGWLALKHHDFMNEVIRREPLLLIQNGDPGSIPLAAKKRLLAVYAERHAAGEIAEDHMEHRAIWMFAQPELAGAIKQAWRINTRQDFRRDLLRMVQEARITECAELAREALADPKSEDYTRIGALAALAACDDKSTLTATAADLAARPEAYNARLASQCSRFLFPNYLSVTQLLHVIEHGQRPRGDTLDGFPAAIGHFYRACPDAHSKAGLLAGLSDLARRPPFVQEYRRISRDFAKIAEELGPVARMALEDIRASDVPGRALVRTLMAVERSERQEYRDDRPPLSSLVRTRPKVNQALFWADVEEVRATGTRRAQLTSVWHIHFGGHQLWELGPSDLGWLRQDLAARPEADDRRIALNGILQVSRTMQGLEAGLPELRASIAGQTVLEEDLASYLAPPRQDPSETEHQRQMAEHQAEAARQEVEDKESWRLFRSEIAADPGRLADPARVVTGEGTSDFRNLTRWLRGRTGHPDNKRAAVHWPQLSAGFGQQVADAYRDGMLRLWRLTQPERPQRQDGGGITTKWANTFAFAAIGIEASLRIDWASQLTPEEAAIAAGHACHCEEGYPDWLDPLIQHHADAVLPILRQTLTKEWRTPAEHPCDLLHHLANARASVPLALQPDLIDIITDEDAPNIRKVELGVRILQKFRLDEAARGRVSRAAMAGLAAVGNNDEPRLLLGLAMLFLVDADAALGRLNAWIDAAPAMQARARTEFALARLFGRDHSLARGVLSILPVPTLSALVHVTYARVSPQDDVPHEGTYTPNTRDEAESARGAILKVLVDRPGNEAFEVVRGLAAAGIAGVPPTRFRELARGKAERDTEPAAWRSAEVVALEQHHTGPIRSADDLLRVVVGVLSDIQRDLVHEDASSRRLILAASSENLVQNWLHEQLRLRAKGRFHLHRETEVADKNEPDIVLSAISAPIELVIEVKHGGKRHWTVAKLEDALTRQLAINYLRPQARRRGMLVITRHGDRTWQAPEDGRVLDFDALVNRLQRLAKPICSNATGPIGVRAMGIDLTIGKHAPKSITRVRKGKKSARRPQSS